MGRLVAEVLFEPLAHVGVDDAAVALGQEEGPPGRELGIVELEEVRERVAVVEDVDLDGVLGRATKAEVGSTSGSSECRQRTGGESAAMGEFE